MRKVYPSNRTAANPPAAEPLTVKEEIKIVEEILNPSFMSNDTEETYFEFKPEIEEPQPILEEVKKEKKSKKKEWSE